jgi:large subunit ribosomal protein L15
MAERRKTAHKKAAAKGHAPARAKAKRAARRPAAQARGASHEGAHQERRAAAPHHARTIGLEHLRPAPGSRRKRKRVGRGPGSGHGKTATRGNKGQLSRSGSTAQYFGFEGGQMPLHRRIPKRGFTNIFRREYAVINVGDLARLDGEITPERLVGEGIIKKLGAGLKVLGDGDLSKALVVRAHRFSRSAREKITAAGGTAEEIAAPAPARS